MEKYLRVIINREKLLVGGAVADLQNFGGGMIKFMSTNCV